MKNYSLTRLFRLHRHRLDAGGTGLGQRPRRPVDGRHLEAVAGVGPQPDRLSVVVAARRVLDCGRTSGPHLVVVILARDTAKTCRRHFRTGRTESPLFIGLAAPPLIIGSAELLQSFYVK